LACAAVPFGLVLLFFGLGSNRFGTRFGVAGIAGVAGLYVLFEEALVAQYYSYCLVE